MKTLWRKNQENSSDRISHAWAPLNGVWHSKKSILFRGQINNSSMFRTITYKLLFKILKIYSFLFYFMYFIQHCFIPCRSSDYTVSDDAASSDAGSMRHQNFYGFFSGSPLVSYLSTTPIIR